MLCLPFVVADTHGDLIWNDVLFRYRLGGLTCLFLSAQATHSDQEENRTFSGEYTRLRRRRLRRMRRPARLKLCALGCSNYARTRVHRARDFDDLLLGRASPRRRSQIERTREREKKKDGEEKRKREDRARKRRATGEKRPSDKIADQ